MTRERLGPRREGGPDERAAGEIELSHSARAIADDDYENAEAANAIRGCQPG